VTNEQGHIIVPGSLEGLTIEFQGKSYLVKSCDFGYRVEFSAEI